MTNRYEYQGITWVDIENPTSEEIDQVTEEFGLGSLLPQELLAPTLKPRVDLYPEFTYTVLHFPASRHTRGVSATQEVDFIIGKHFIITVSYDTVDAIYDFSRSFEAATLLKQSGGEKFHSGHVFFELAERLYEEVEHELESIEDSVNEIEHNIFSGHERAMVVSISSASRELLNHKRALSTHREILESLEKAGVSLFGEDFGDYLRAVTAFHFRIYNHVLALMDTVQALRDTNNALLSTRQNEIMKNLTIMTFVTAPLTLIVSLFSMNTKGTPIVGQSGDFWIIIGMMLFVGLCLALYFKRKKWF